MSSNRETHFLYPATLFANNRSYEVTTILGSCIAICLYDPVLKIGGINHYMLPLWNGNGLASPKYGNIAIPALIEKLEYLGSSKSNMIAKVFGGWEKEEFSQVLNIGRRNRDIAFDMLNAFKIPVISSNTGGKSGRKLVFLTNTGDVFMKYIQSDNL